MWSEEELRDIPDPPRPRPTGARSLASHLRRELSARNLSRARAHPHELTRGTCPSVIYTPTQTLHGNFIDSSYRRILANCEWSRRLLKTHTAKRQARLTSTRDDSWRELDAASSSDALLMNIFCYPRILSSPAVPALLGIDRNETPIFGFKPRIPFQRSSADTTEIDLKLGHLLLEAKLTESDFQSAPLRKLDRYRDFHLLFDPELLPQTPSPSGPIFHGYQLLRGVLAAHALEASFCVLCDARRPDLIASWYTVQCAVRSFTLQSRLRLLTWQELLPALPKPLTRFLAEKYGIHPKS
jgi:hypothetical protein